MAAVFLEKPLNLMRLASQIHAQDYFRGPVYCFLFHDQCFPTARDRIPDTAGGAVMFRSAVLIVMPPVFSSRLNGPGRRRRDQVRILETPLPLGGASGQLFRVE